VEAKIYALQDVPSRELTLHLVAIERRITGITGNNGETEFNSVVTTMMPDAGGTTFYKSWSKGEDQIVNHSWDIEHIYDLEELLMVAFIQDELTKEVYQASLDTVRIQTGTEDLPGSHQAQPGYYVFFDPSSSCAIIRFTEPLKQDVQLELYNNLGSMITSGQVSSGETQAEFSVADCADGIYLIRLTGNQKLIGTSKLTILR